jgi:PmbA protein
MYDARTASLASGGVEPLADRLRTIRELATSWKLRTWSGSFSAGIGRSRVITSAGLDERSEGTNQGWYLTLNGEVGDGYTGRVADSAEAFRRRLERVGRLSKALERTGEPPSPGVHPVLLHPQVVRSYVIGTLFSNLAGARVSDGDGHFRREQFGAESAVLREDIGLRIDPLLPLRAGNYRYTIQGVPAAPCAYIERGRLIRPVLDLKYARRLDMAPTPVPSGADTLFFEGGSSMTPEEAMAHAGAGVFVLSVLGVHTQDSASGDFSLSAPQALALADGSLAGRLRGTISGNLFRSLNDPELRFVSFPDEPIPGLLLPCRFDPQ